MNKAIIKTIPFLSILILLCWNFYLDRESNRAIFKILDKPTVMNTVNNNWLDKSEIIDTMISKFKIIRIDTVWGVEVEKAESPEIYSFPPDTTFNNSGDGLDEELVKGMLDGDTILPGWKNMTKELRCRVYYPCTDTLKEVPFPLPTIDQLKYLIVDDSIKLYVWDGDKNRCFMSYKLESLK